MLKVPNAALRFQPVGVATMKTAAAGEAQDPALGTVVWLLKEDGAPDPVRVALGRSNESATEITGGPLRAGQQVVVGTAVPPEEDSWFGIRWRL